ncbi:MAG TPA: hypothetical protein PKA74_11430 [Bauldia sp.]|nr:hypothetical protein [Bauldia sp.]
MATADELRAVSEEKLADAILLIENERWSNAYYLFGYAVEVALKVVIARRFRANEIPDRTFVNKVHTHDLDALVNLAELAGARSDRAAADSAFAANWAVVADWDEVSRYRQVEKADAVAMASAMLDADAGVMSWLKQYW